MPNVHDEVGTHVLVAGVSARAMAESAARAGYVVTSLDAFGDLDRSPGVTALSVPRDFGMPFSAASTARAAMSISADAAVYLPPFENHPRSVSRLADGRALWGNPPSVLRRSRNPALVAELLASQAPLPITADDRCLLKPRASGGGRRIAWWRPGDPIPKGMYVQRFVDGVAGSVVFVAAQGRAVPLGLTRQIVGDEAFGASGFRYCGNILAASGDPQFAQDDALFHAACRLADVAARELQLVGVNGIDFVADRGIPVPIEINPRYSASMELVERAYGISVFGAHAMACTTGDLPPFDLRGARAGARATAKSIVFARHDVVCGDTHAWLADTNVRDIPHPGEHIPAGRPVCTVFADGNDSDDCYDQLNRRAAAVYEALDNWASVAA